MEAEDTMRQKHRRAFHQDILISAFLCLLAQACTTGSAAAQTASPAAGYYHHSAAEAKLNREIHAVGSWLQNYCQMNYKFPVQPNDVRYAKSQLIDVAPVNPFTEDYDDISNSTSVPGAGTADARISPQDEQRFQLSVDYGLSNYMLGEWAHHTPDYWQAEPGTITAISNDKNMFVVWGAGADGRPIRDDITGHAVLVVGRWRGSWTQDESTDTSTDTSSSD